MNKNTSGPSARCKLCKTIIQSKYRHDMVGCNCPKETRIYIDGGSSYVKCSGNYEQFEWLEDDSK